MLTIFSSLAAFMQRVAQLCPPGGARCCSEECGGLAFPKGSPWHSWNSCLGGTPHPAHTPACACPSLTEQPPGGPAAKTQTPPGPWALTARPCAHGKPGQLLGFFTSSRIQSLKECGLFYVRGKCPKISPHGADVLSPHDLDCVWCCTSSISLF